MYACDIKFVGINVRSTAESAKTAIFYTLEIYPLYSIINFKQLYVLVGSPAAQCHRSMADKALQ